MSPDEGPVLHQLSLDGRPILHRVALSDMVVPYGTADPMHSWKAVHDGTEYGFGTLVNSLTLGCDCLGEIHYMDANMLMFDGSVNTIESAICIHEEDYGIQWKHMDMMSLHFLSTILTTYQYKKCCLLCHHMPTISAPRPWRVKKVSLIPSRQRKRN